jgi:2-C-methyl-D-erythritol 4-phosphate cytidylyltransferase
MTSAVIVAAGRGVRMGGEVDKLFLEVAGRPVAAHAWSQIDRASCVHEVVLVVRDGQQAKFQSMAVAHGFKKPFRLTVGGEERQDSVWNGLKAIDPRAELVAIHDAARPCVSEATFSATLEAANRLGAAVAAQRVVDTIKESDGHARIARTVDRSRLWSVQTPQAFRVQIILKALERVRESGQIVTDDTAACEMIGQPVELVESIAPNPKVTVASDLGYVEMLLRASQER